jgi:hypothetical protein
MLRRSFRISSVGSCQEESWQVSGALSLNDAPGVDGAKIEVVESDQTFPVGHGRVPWVARVVLENCCIRIVEFNNTSAMPRVPAPFPALALKSPLCSKWDQVELAWR